MRIRSDQNSCNDQTSQPIIQAKHINRDMKMTYTEAQIRNEACKELLRARGQTLTTSELITRLTKRLQPTGKDAEIATNRSDTYFSQKVRNLVSHRNQSTGLVACGIADYDSVSESWTLTKTGRRHAAHLK